MPKAKYNNRNVNGFDSKKEHKRFLELDALERAGEISELKRQVEFILIPSQLISTGTLRAIKYIADFTYRKDGALVVEDVKPTDRTGNVSKSYKGTAAWHEYMIKKKLMKYVHNIEIKEV